MATMSDELISIAVRPEDSPRERMGFQAERGTYLGDYLKPDYVEIPVSQFQANLDSFLGKIKTALSSVPDSFGEFHLETITVSAEVNGKGGFAILGLPELGGKAGITFSFKRPLPQK